MTQNVIWLVIVSSAYFLMSTVIPFWLRGFRFSGKNVTDRLINTFLISNIIIILVSCLLSLAGIYYRSTLIFSLISIAAAYRFLFRRKESLDALRNFIEGFYYLKEGYYHIGVLLKNIWGNVKCAVKSIVRKITNPAEFVCTAAIFGVALYVRCYHSVTNLFFGSSDMYLHTEWIKYFMQNRPFLSGVYPFGFHATAASVSCVFGINTVTVMQMFGPVSGMLIVFSLYYILKRTMRSAFAVNIALALYVVTDLFPFWASERQFLALPQEWATAVLYLAAYFLYKYMKDKKAADLVSFSAAVSLTLLTHFFVTIYAVLICVPIFISCIIYLNRKVFTRLVIGVLCAFFVAILPLAGGLARGISFNGSMNWAISVITGTKAEAPAESEAEENVSPEKKESLFESVASIYHTMKNEGFFIRSYNLSILNVNWFLPYLIGAGIALIMPAFKFKDKERQWVFPALSVYSLTLVVLFVLAFFGIFSLMEYDRLYSYFIYSVPLVIAAPVELLHNLLCGANTKKAAKLVYIALMSAVSLSGVLYFGLNERVVQLGRVWQPQYNGAVQSYYNIVENFPKNQWIIVSSMTEYSQCLFEGYHYDAVAFLMDMNDYDGDTKIYFPSENVFVYAVKRPNLYRDTDIHQLGTSVTLPEYDPDDVYIDLKTYGAKKKGGTWNIYKNPEANRVVQAKLHAWAAEYQKYFPDEMTVFYEDDEIIIYRIKQNVYALNNFAIPYKGNTEIR